MSGTIICAVDDSDGAEAALHVARRLAERFDARILLVGVAGGFPARGVNGDRPSTAYHLRPEEHRVAEGDPAEAVAVIAAEEAADLIVVGARRGVFGSLRRITFARELASTASCPVVVAPPEAAEP
jgi:nucleotide-binding universal stress UspA family protein